MTPTQQHALVAAANCQVAFDNLTRQLYATDASHYQIEPVAVAFPRDARQACSVIEAAAQAGVPVIPRGAGTGLAGGAIGEGVVIDFSRYNRLITNFDPERRTVRVGAGVVLDQLNQFLSREGFCFGPDVATSSRATIGGMIANDSSGAHAPVYGTTADHVTEIDFITRDAQVVKVGPTHETLPRQRELLENMAMLNALEIGERFPPGMVKRWPGYALARAVKEPGNLINILAGSEGTLGAIISAELKVVPLPEEIGLGVIFFSSIAEAMEASVQVLDLKPAAVEHLDRILFDRTRGQREFEQVRQLLDLDEHPCESILAVEFYGDVEDRLAELQKRKLGQRRKVMHTLAQINQFWGLRKAGLSLLTSRQGGAKPVTGVEDTAVRPRDLPAYYKGLQSIMARLGLEASYYGHAAAGLLHVRPVLDLHSAADVKKFREVTEEVAALVGQFNGSLAAEHGVGIARTEFMRQQVGDEAYQLMKEIKRSFDPHNLFNPGKIVGDGRYKLDTKLRQMVDGTLRLPVEPVLAFAARDGSFVANLEQCNGCGACRKEAPTMCPTFLATGEEIMSTRGRANAIRAALALRGIKDKDAIASDEMEAALSNCLSCKACTTECPSNVNMALLKAEIQHARIERDGLSLCARIFSSPDRWGRLGCKFPWLANLALNSFVIRKLLTKLTGISAQRPLLPYAKQRFDHWYAQHAKDGLIDGPRVVLWDDTFVRYNEPNIGIAAVKVLEAAGFQVVLPHKRKCCGRPAFSQGNLDEARRLGAHNLALLAEDADNAPIVFLEPSCYSMFVEDYRELKLPEVERVASRCFLFEEFMSEVLKNQPGALTFAARQANLLIHAHCHAKALTETSYMHRLAMRLPDRRVTYLDTGCCGMAGGFGMLDSKFGLSLEVAKPLVEKIRSQPFGSIVISSGASCRQQINHLVPIKVQHMAEVLADALE